MYKVQSDVFMGFTSRGAKRVKGGKKGDAPQGGRGGGGSGGGGGGGGSGGGSHSYKSPGKVSEG